MKSSKYKLATNAVAWCLILAFAVAGQSPREIQKLSLNQPFERQIKGGETHVFEFDVKAGFYARAEVEQKNIDFRVR